MAVRTGYCIKCGRSGLQPIFHRFSSDCPWGYLAMDGVVASSRKGAARRHLHYKCTCGYDWAEPCNDSTERELQREAK